MSHSAQSIKQRRLQPEEMRARVIDGVLAVIAADGVEGLTHRRVADAAGVSLSTTTYYFANLEDMLVAAMKTQVERDVGAVRARFADVTPDVFPDLLPSYVADALREDPGGVAVFAEIYVAALRRERLRALVDQWEDMWAELLEPVVGSAARAASAAIGGILVRARVLDDQRDAESAAADVRALLEPLLRTTS